MSDSSPDNLQNTTDDLPAEKSIPENAVRLADSIRRGVEQRGWFHLRERISLREYDTLSSGLGDLELRTDVKVDAEKRKSVRRNDQAERVRPTVYSSAALDLHTDRPTADVLGWYCVKQDVTEGALCLLDLWPVLASLTEEDLELLQSVPIRYHVPNALGVEEALTEPLLVRTASRYKVYFAPWHLGPNLSGPRRQAVARFQEAVNRSTRNAALQVRLEPGESLFIDNRRLLHGRGAIAPESQRHLVRYYIRLR
jgi:alpha-ketoglutarate-dependent taurine dioxygenase